MGDGSRDDRTCYIRNLDDKVTEEILFELFLQAGPLVGVKRPKDQDGSLRPFAFVEFEHDISPPYARQLMDGTKLYGRNIGVQFRSGSKHNQNTQGNSPASTSPFNSGVQNNRSGGGPGQAPNGYQQNYQMPPQVQRAMSAPQGLLVNPNVPMGLPHEMQNAFVVGNAHFLGDRQQQQFHQMQFGGMVDGQGARQVAHDHRDSGSHHRRSSQDHQRRSYHSQGSEDERSSSRSNRQDDYHHRHGSSGRQDPRDDWRQHSGSDERRHGGYMQRHQSHQHNRSARREHPYRR
ncbi:uncharacterized protein [Asterias amurensis]|uniref:uncharacterized protein n=1 Tax=Asterias amurensis TaxID=7602 RepID=UPI003AB16FB6